MTTADPKGNPHVIHPSWAARILIIAPLSALYRLILWLVHFMDDALAVKVVYILIWPTMLLFRGRRMLNLSRLFFPLGWTQQQCSDLSRKYVLHHARLVLEAVRLSDLTPAQVRQRVIFEGERYLANALKQGRGVLIVGNHIGNWLFSVAFLSASGYRVSAVAYDIPIRSIESHMKSLWRKYELAITNVGRGAPAAALQAFKRNGIFLVLTDVSLRPSRGKWLQLGNTAINVDTGPARLALMTDAPILHLSNYRKSNSHFVISLSPGMSRETISRNLHPEEYLAQSWLNILYEELMVRPEQWWLLTLIPLRIPTTVPLFHTTEPVRAVEAPVS